MNKKAKLKIPPMRVASDECIVHIGRVYEDGEIKTEGTPYHVHEGEWVEVMPVATVNELVTLYLMQGLSDEPESIGSSLLTLCEHLCQRIVAWNWTDMTGAALSQPYGKPEVLHGLTPDELMWLTSAAQGAETPEQRGNGYVPSENTYSLMADSPPTP